MIQHKDIAEGGHLQDLGDHGGRRPRK